MSPRPLCMTLALAALATIPLAAAAGTTLSGAFRSVLFCPECYTQTGLVFSEPTEIMPPGLELRALVKGGLDPNETALQIVKLRIGDRDQVLLSRHAAGQGGGKSWELAGLADLDGDGKTDFVWGTMSARGKKFSASLDVDLSVTVASVAAGETDASLVFAGKASKEDLPTEIESATLTRGGKGQPLSGGLVELSD